MFYQGRGDASAGLAGSRGDIARRRLGRSVRGRHVHAQRDRSRPITVADRDVARRGAEKLISEHRKRDAQDKFDDRPDDMQDSISQAVGGSLIWPADSGAAIAFLERGKGTDIPVVAVNAPFGRPDTNDPFASAGGWSGS